MMCRNPFLVLLWHHCFLRGSLLDEKVPHKSVLVPNFIKRLDFSAESGLNFSAESALNISEIFIFPTICWSFSLCNAILKHPGQCLWRKSRDVSSEMTNLDMLREADPNSYIGRSFLGVSFFPHYSMLLSTQICYTDRTNRGEGVEA